MSQNFTRSRHPWLEAARDLIGHARPGLLDTPTPKSPRAFGTGSKYRPHQGAWECQRRVMQRRGEWPRKNNHA